jgi:hypothetical protein
MNKHKLIKKLIRMIKLLKKDNKILKEYIRHKEKKNHSLIFW